MNRKKECWDGSDYKIEWTTPAEPRRASKDPLCGLRPQGSSAHFWENGDVSSLSLAASTSSPSTLSLKKKSTGCRDFKFRCGENNNVVEGSHMASVKIMDSFTPVSLDPQTAKARSIVSTLFGDKNCGKPWQGPLPPPIISPPMTLGACPVHDR